MKRILRRSNQMLRLRSEGSYQVRVFHRKKYRKRCSRFLLKCGCCDRSVEIYYDDQELEINGVLGSIKDWREILLPILEVE